VTICCASAAMCLILIIVIFISLVFRLLMSDVLGFWNGRNFFFSIEELSKKSSSVEHVNIVLVTCLNVEIELGSRGLLKSQRLIN
jgi:hypothetical protein